MMKFFLSLLFLTNLSLAQTHEQDGYEQISRGKITRASSVDLRIFALAHGVCSSTVATFRSPLGVTVKIIGTCHAEGNDSSPFRAFSRVLENCGPDVALLEGYSGQITSELVEKHNWGDEMHYGALLALQKGIEAWGMEPTQSQTVSLMKERGFTGQDPFFYCMYGTMHGAPLMGEGTFSKQTQISWVVKTWCEIWEKTPEGLRELDQLSDEFKERDYMKIAGRFQEWEQNLTSTQLREMSDCLALLRDQSMLQALMDRVGNGDKNIVMMYGAKHFAKQYNASCYYLQCEPTYERPLWLSVALLGASLAQEAALDIVRSLIFS